MPKFTTDTDAHEAGYPETLNQSPLRLDDLNKIAETVDVLTDRNPAMSQERAIKLAVRAFDTMHVFSRGAWRLKREIVLGGVERVVIRNES